MKPAQNNGEIALGMAAYQKQTSKDKKAGQAFKASDTTQGDTGYPSPEKPPNKTPSLVQQDSGYASQPATSIPNSGQLSEDFSLFPPTARIEDIDLDLEDATDIAQIKSFFGTTHSYDSTHHNHAARNTVSYNPVRDEFFECIPASNAKSYSTTSTDSASYTSAQLDEWARAFERHEDINYRLLNPQQDYDYTW